VDALDVRPARGADPTALGRRLDERTENVGERLLRRLDDRDVDSERLPRALDRLVVEERDDGLAERHRLDGEEPVPAGVQLVDDDVRALVALASLVVMEALDDLELDRELLAGGDHVLGPLALAVGRRVEDDGPRAVARRA